MQASGAPRYALHPSAHATSSPLFTQHLHRVPPQASGQLAGSRLEWPLRRLRALLDQQQGKPGRHSWRQCGATSFTRALGKSCPPWSRRHSTTGLCAGARYLAAVAAAAAVPPAAVAAALPLLAPVGAPAPAPPGAPALTPAPAQSGAPAATATPAAMPHPPAMATPSAMPGATGAPAGRRLLQAPLLAVPTQVRHAPARASTL